MLRRVGDFGRGGAGIPIRDATFPAPFDSGLEYSSPARGTWNIVHTGMLIPEAHEIFVCAAGCLRGVVLTAAEMDAMDRFSTVAVREHNLLDGDLEPLIIEGVSDILEKLPKLPPAVLVYTSCVHHFTGCDLDYVYAALRERWPQVDFTDCYMNPIMRKSGLTPDQLMRARLYSLLKPRPIDPGAVAIIGNDLPTDPDSDLMRLLRSRRVREITSCRTYAEYQEMAESAYYISYYPAARAGGDILEKRLGGRHFYLPFSFDYDEIEDGFTRLAEALDLPSPDFTGKREQCGSALSEALRIIGNRPIAIDYIAGEEKAAFEALRERHPELALFPTVDPQMRFHSAAEKTDFLAIGQKAAHFTNTDHFVNVVEGGGMNGFQAITKTLEYMTDAHYNTKDMRNLVQIKGLGCACCL